MSRVAPSAVGAPSSAAGRASASLRASAKLASSRAQEAEQLSECAAEYARLVQKMQESLKQSNYPGQDATENELRSAITTLVNGVQTVLTAIAENNTSLGDCKGASAKILAKADEALRKASEAQRFIDERQSSAGNEFLQTQPLDSGKFVS